MIFFLICVAIALGTILGSYVSDKYVLNVPAQKYNKGVNVKLLNHIFSDLPKDQRPEFCEGCGAGRSMVEGECRECGSRN